MKENNMNCCFAHCMPGIMPPVVHTCGAFAVVFLLLVVPAVVPAFASTTATLVPGLSPVSSLRFREFPEAEDP